MWETCFNTANIKYLFLYLHNHYIHFNLTACLCWIMDCILQFNHIMLHRPDHSTSEAGSTWEAFFFATWSSAFTVPSPSLSLISVFHCLTFSSLLNWQRTEGEGLVHLVFTLRKVRHASVSVVTYSRNDQLCDSEALSLLFPCPHCLLQFVVQLPNWVFKVSLFAGNCFQSPQRCGKWLLVSYRMV